MPPLRVLENIDAGGVDSRSNPINMPRNRALRCLNWAPRQAGFWEQRWGYTSATMSTVSASAISGLFPYRTWDGHKYVLFFQGTTPKTLDTSTGTVTSPTVLGTAIASSSKGNGYFANNRFHYGNGTDQKWFDGTNWRDNGLPALALSETAMTSVVEGVRELTPTQASTITLTVGASGNFLGDSLTGHLIYVAIFDTNVNEIGPATISVGPGRIVIPVNDKLTVANMPSLAGVNTAWVKLIAGTADGANLAYFFTNTNTNINSCTIGSGGSAINISTITFIAKHVRGSQIYYTYSVTTSSPHGLNTGNSTTIAGVTPSTFNGSYPVTVTSTTTFEINLSSNPTYVSGGTATAAGLIVSATGHGLSTGDVVILAGTVNFDGVYSITVIDANTFSTALPNSNSATGAVGTVSRIVKAANATTSIDVTAPTQDNTYQVNQNIGLAASTIGGPNAGYQFYACIYNPNGGGHIGNRVAIGSRALQTAYRSNWRINRLPFLNVSSTEWVTLIGRTGDGAQVPYPCTDNSGNYLTVPNTSNLCTVSLNANLATQEMPSRNGIIPSQCAMFCVAGDFCYAADPASPFLRRSGDLSQAVERGNTLLGRPEQSWAPNDIDTFPTGEKMSGIFEVDQEVFCGTLHDCALSVNLAGLQQWNGPWAIGIAGPRAGTKCGGIGFYWVTGDKQLATFINGVPVIVSDEYELAELSQIGSAFLSTVECVYYRNAANNKEELRIEVQLASGAPYTIIHDFKLREIFSAPGSTYGQGYSSQFQGPLGTVFTSALVRDGNGALQVFSGASNGQIYQLYTGADDASVQFTSDLILLVNGGPNRPSVPFVDYYGDQNVKVTVGRNLMSSIAAGAQWGFDPPGADANVPQSVPGAEQDFLYRVYLVPPEVQRLYIRFQLTSHSADGSLALNSPVHVPLESYGRIYELIPAVGEERDR